ncbi:MAG: recombinase family protein [Thermodesulfobacteriota bacterium]
METTKGAGYTRVSSTDQTDNTSLEAQRKQIESYCQLKGIDLVEVFSDPGVSGGKPLAHRPAGSRLVEKIRSKEVGCVILPKLDRGFRSASDCLTVIEQWQAVGINLHIVDLGGNSVDTTAPAGKFMISVLAAAAEMERGMIRERCNAGRRARKAAGERIGEVPFGWSLGPNGRTLVPNEKEQEARALIFSLHRSGHSLRSIAAELERRGIRTKKGGRWSHRQISSILRSAA